MRAIIGNNLGTKWRGEAAFHNMDSNVVLGYQTGRRVSLSDLVIGQHARIRAGTIIYSNTSIGDYLETGHNVVIREENVIGDYFSIWSNSTVDYGCQIGNHVRVHCNVYIAQYTIIEDDVFLGPGVMIANDLHPICTKCMQGPHIKRGARIGINSTLLPHIVIGEYAIVGAGSVVTKDVPPKTVVYGNPARITGASDELECPLGIVDSPYVDGKDVRCRELSNHVLKSVAGEKMHSASSPPVNCVYAGDVTP